MGQTRSVKPNRSRRIATAVQGRLAIRFPEDGEFGNPDVESRAARTDGTSSSRRRDRSDPQRKRSGQAERSPVVHPPAYRRVLAGWSDDWRERWGRLANSLEETGLSWRDAETQAFVEVWKQIREDASHANPQADFVQETRSSMLN